MVPEAVLAAGLEDWSAMVLTDGHPYEGQAVTSANARYHAVGHVGGDARMVDGLMHASLVVTDQSAIDRIRAGTRQLSIGAFFSRRPDPTETHDYIIERAVPNHVALVERGMCGSACSLQLHHHPENTMPCNCSAEVAQLRAAQTATQEQLTAERTRAETERGRAETALAQLAARIAGEDVRVAARIALLAEVRAMGAEPTAGATDLALMADAVAARIPAMAVPAREAATAGNTAYVQAAYAAARAVPAGPTAAAQVAAAQGAAQGAPESLEALRLATCARLAGRAA